MADSVAELPSDLLGGVFHICQRPMLRPDIPRPMRPGLWQAGVSAVLAGRRRCSARSVEVVW